MLSLIVLPYLEKKKPLHCPLRVKAERENLSSTTIPDLKVSPDHMTRFILAASLCHRSVPATVLPIRHVRIDLRTPGSSGGWIRDLLWLLHASKGVPEVVRVSTLHTYSRFQSCSICFGSLQNISPEDRNPISCWKKHHVFHANYSCCVWYTISETSLLYRSIFVFLGLYRVHCMRTTRVPF